MTDFVPVTLVKGDRVFEATTASDYVHAVFSLGFAPVTADAEAEEPAETGDAATTPEAVTVKPKSRRNPAPASEGEPE